MILKKTFLAFSWGHSHFEKHNIEPCKTSLEWHVSKGEYSGLVLHAITLTMQEKCLQARYKLKLVILKAVQHLIGWSVVKIVLINICCSAVVPYYRYKEEKWNLLYDGIVKIIFKTIKSLLSALLFKFSFFKF